MKKFLKLVNDGRKNRLAVNVCTKYISSEQGNIIFKDKISDYINNSVISKKIGLYIILELLYDITNSRLTQEEEIEFYSFNIFKKIDRIYEEQNIDSDSKIEELFSHDYRFEKSIVQKYLRKTSKGTIPSLNSINLDNNKSINDSSQMGNENTINIVKPVSNEKLIINLDNYDIDELCEILDFDPYLNYYSKDELKDMIHENFSITKAIYDSENLSLKQIKKYLKCNNKKNLEKQKLIFNAKHFINKDLFDLYSSKEKYFSIYSEINSYPDYIENQYIEIFMSFHDYINEIDELFDSYEKLELKKDKIDEFNNQIKNRYMDFNLRNEIILKFKDLYELVKIIKKFPDSFKNKLYKNNGYFKDFYNKFQDLIDYINISESSEDNFIRKNNEKYLDSIIDLNPEFFNDIEDINKKRAIVLDNKNIKVIAGAGTGKTFIIQKKVKYLIEKKNISPEKILCLCYTNKGANSLNEKVNSNLDKNNQVEVCTFHEFSRRVDRECGGNRSTNRYLLDYIIRNYIKEIVDNPEKMNKFLEYFSYYVNEHDEEEFDTYDELLEYESDMGLETLKEKYYRNEVIISSFKGETVKSLGELIIANYLFMHDINYEYESNYNRSFANLIEKRFLYSGKYLSLNKIADISNKLIVKNFINEEKRWERYQPDFYLPDYDIYLEHFGIGRTNNEKWLHKNYEKEIDEKVNYHKLHGTKLIKTYYYDLAEGNLHDNLRKLLEENNVEFGQRNQEELINILTTTDKVNDFNNFNKLVKTFLNIFESKNMTKEDFEKFKLKNKSENYIYTQKRQEIFFDIVSDIYDKYHEYDDGDTIDHNREISNALELIQSKKYDKKYEYILIDEYQDINYIRCKLLQELQKNTGCHIFVVGDDWQSIYAFNGSDVNLFINFKDYFENPEVIKLEKGYRNSQVINDVTSGFILRNPNQEVKKLSYYDSENDSNLNPIKIVRYDNSSYYWNNNKKNKILTLDAIIQDIISNNPKDNLKILLLGRNNKDIKSFINNSLFKSKKEKKYVKILYSKDLNLDITFMTIHQSKGLEYDEVVILNFNDSTLGFPNQITDDQLLKFVKDYEDCYYAEERRLLYVALTRTLNNVYLLSPTSNESIFIDELERKFKIKNIKLPLDEELRLYGESDFFKSKEYFETDIDCPNCDEGKITIVVDNKRGTKYARCSTDLVGKSYHYDGGPYNGSIDDIKYIEKCPSCRGILERHGDILKCCLNGYEGCLETKNLKLDEEDLKYIDFEN